MALQFKYEPLTFPLSIKNLETVNENFSRIEDDLTNLSTKLLGSLAKDAKVNYLTPVANFAAIATTYPSPTVGDAVQTLDDNKIYRYNGTSWIWILEYGIGPIDYLTAEIEKRLNVGRAAHAYAGVIRREGTGWIVADDTGRQPINVLNVTEVGSPFHRLEVGILEGSKAGAITVSPSADLAKYGVTLGTYPTNENLWIEAYAPLVGSCEADTTVLTLPPFFAGTVDVSLSTQGDWLYFTYDGSGNEFEKAIVTPVVDDESPFSSVEYQATRLSDFAVSVQAVAPLYAYISFNGSTFDVVTSCNANITANWEGQQLRISHAAMPWVEGYEQRLDNVITNRTPLSADILHAQMASVTQFGALVNFYNEEGTRITSPNQDMRIYFSRPSFKVPHKIPPGAKFNFDFGLCKVRPSKLGIPGNSISILGINNA